MPLYYHSRFRWLAVLLGLGAFSGPAAARPPTADDFEITYRFTDDEGEVIPSQLLTQNDLLSYVNRARCQCGEKFGARIFLKPAQGEAYDPGMIRSFVGSNCSAGQDGNSLQSRPCIKFTDAQPIEYDNGGLDVVFDLVWLSSRVPNLGSQALEDATPVDPCASGQNGTAGIWICTEDGNQSDCQSNEFIISGAQNNNGTSTDPSQQNTGSIAFDYQVPQVSIDGFRHSSGDGKVAIEWNSTESNAQISGFRVLCADMDGAPARTLVTGAPSGSARNNGKLYYTADNLCPGEVVYPAGDDGSNDDDPSDSLTSTDSGREREAQFATTGTTTTDTSSTGPDFTTGTTTGTSSDTGGGDATGDSVGSSACSDGDASPLCGLDWSYICTEHLSNTATRAEILDLENGRQYQFLVVAYDAAGNPLIVSDLLTETPAETTDFWEQCEAQGDLCGRGGFCHCRTNGSEPPPLWLGAGLLLLGLVGRRRRKATLR